MLPLLIVTQAFPPPVLAVKTGNEARDAVAKHTSQLISYYGVEHRSLSLQIRPQTIVCSSLQFIVTTVATKEERLCLIWTMSISKNSRTTTVHYSLQSSSNFSFVGQLQPRRKSLKCDSNV